MSSSTNRVRKTARLYPQVERAMNNMSTGAGGNWTKTLDRWLQGYIDCLSLAALSLTGRERSWCSVVASLVGDRDITEESIHGLLHNGNLPDAVAFCTKFNEDVEAFVVSINNLTFYQKMACMEAAQLYRAARRNGTNPDIESMFDDLRTALAGEEELDDSE